MKLGNIHHRIRFMCMGEQFDALIYLNYRATRARMNRHLYQIVIDEGLRFSDIYDVQFTIDGQSVYEEQASPLPCF